jgi:hypothetical protein
MAILNVPLRTPAKCAESPTWEPIGSRARSRRTERGPVKDKSRRRRCDGVACQKACIKAVQNDDSFPFRARTPT